MGGLVGSAMYPFEETLYFDTHAGQYNGHIGTWDIEVGLVCGGRGVYVCAWVALRVLCICDKEKGGIGDYKQICRCVSAGWLELGAELVVRFVNC